MNTYYIIYKFNKMCIDALDDKYKEQIKDIDDSYLYLYSNLIEIAKFYNLYYPIKNHYSLYTEFFKDPNKFITSLINYIKLNGYNKYDIVLLYSISSYIVISNSSYFNNLGLKDDKYYSSFKSYLKEFPLSHKFNLYTLDTLNTILSNEYNLLDSTKYLTLALDKYNRYLVMPSFITFKYNLLSVFNKKKPFKLKNKALKLIKKEEINENLDMLLFEYKTFIEHVNQALYFGKAEKLLNFIKEKIKF